MAAPSEILCCPQCGLLIKVTHDEHGVQLTYPAATWGRLCHAVEFDSPALCPDMRALMVRKVALATSPKTKSAALPV